MLTPGRLDQWDCWGGAGGLNKEPKIVRSDRIIHAMITCDSYSLLFIMTIYYLLFTGRIIIIIKDTEVLRTPYSYRGKKENRPWLYPLHTDQNTSVAPKANYRRIAQRRGPPT